MTAIFTWQKQLTQGADINPTATTTGGVVNDVFNRPINKYLSQFDQPFVFNTSINYIVPTFKFGDAFGGKTLSWVARDWTFGAFLQYASGLPIQAPAAQNSLNNVLFRGTFANRLPDQPLFLQDLNCHCFDPNHDFVLNPKAWTDPAKGQFGTSAAYYSDYRQQRRPSENFSFGRTFRVSERVSFNIRAEFTNVLNRTEMNSPTSTNALATPTRQIATDPNSKTTAGFGWINTASLAKDPRSGVIVGRLTF